MKYFYEAFLYEILIVRILSRPLKMIESIFDIVSIFRNFSLPWLVKRPGAKSDQNTKKSRQSIQLQAPQKNKQTAYNTRT